MDCVREGEEKRVEEDAVERGKAAALSAGDASGADQPSSSKQADQNGAGGLRWFVINEKRS